MKPGDDFYQKCDKCGMWNFKSELCECEKTPPWWSALFLAPYILIPLGLAWLGFICFGR